MSNALPNSKSAGEADVHRRPSLGMQDPAVRTASAVLMSSSWKSIAVFVDDTPQGEKVANHAASLAEQCGAHLIGIHAISGYPGETLASSFARGKQAIDAVIAEKQAAEEARALAVARHFAAVARRRAISTEFRIIWAGHADEAVPNALHCDLVVLGDPEPPGLPEDWSADRILIAAGVPVLIIPERWSAPTIGARALVAWNGSREARRAIADAMPLLIRAKSVTVLVVDAAKTPERFGEEPGADISLVLSRHDVLVDLEQITSDGLSIAETIIARAEAQAMDLIVIGAYSHPRSAEIVLGGVTRAVLNNATRPLLLSR